MNNSQALKGKIKKGGLPVLTRAPPRAPFPDSRTTQSLEDSWSIKVSKNTVSTKSIEIIDSSNRFALSPLRGALPGGRAFPPSDRVKFARYVSSVGLIFVLHDCIPPLAAPWPGAGDFSSCRSFSTSPVQIPHIYSCRISGTPPRNPHSAIPNPKIERDSTH